MRLEILRHFCSDALSIVCAVILIMVTTCAQEKQWEDTTGARTARNIGKWFEDSWVGEPWGSIKLRSMVGDSVRGFSADGQIAIRGSVVRDRIDVEIHPVDGGDVLTGYFYLIPDTDSVFVGLRAPGGSWSDFFSMIRERKNGNR